MLFSFFVSNKYFCLFDDMCIGKLLSFHFVAKALCGIWSQIIIIAFLQSVHPTESSVYC